MAVPIYYLRDDFADNSQAAAWGASSVQGSATKAETGGQAVLTLPSSTAGTHVASYTSSGTYDLTGNEFYWNIGTMVSTSVAASAFFQLLSSGDANNQVYWRQLSNAITARKVVAGVDTQLFTATWSSSTYKYLKIRESGGTIFFDSSTNGTSWTNRASIVGLPFSVSEMVVQFAASCGNVASPGSLRLDDVNLILPAISSTWHWTQVEWPLLYRFRSCTIATSAIQVQGYIATSEDGTTWTYYSGPVGSSSGGYNALTLASTQAIAQAMAVNLPMDGRLDLPVIDECRFIRLYHRTTIGASYTLREFYPRRLVQSDDVEAESITALNIAAGTITADRITAAFTITGKTIQTNVAGARAVMNGDLNGGFIGYNATDTFDPVTGLGTYQVLWSKVNGALYAGGGNVSLDDTGVSIVANTLGGFVSKNSLRFLKPSDGSAIGYLTSTIDVSNFHLMTLKTQSSLNGRASMQLSATGTGTSYGDILISADSPTNGASIHVNGLNSVVELDVDVTIPFGKLDVAGRITSDVGFDVDTPAATTAIIRWLSAGVDQWVMYRPASTNDLRINRSGTGDILSFSAAGGIGFFGGAGTTKQTVTGSRAGNAALASLLTALAAHGLIVNSSTA